MQNTKSISKEQDLKITSSIHSFFKEFKVKKILSQSKISKLRGVPVTKIMLSIFRLPFIHKNFYEGVVNNEESGFNKTVAYDFLNNTRYNWRLFLYKIVMAVITQFIKPLTSDCREDVLILDDTGYPRNRSENVELLARVFDHVKMTFFKGFRIMQLGWSDGNSFIPLDFALLSSVEKANRYQEMNCNLDKRSCAYKRKKEAICKSTDLIVPMIKRAVNHGIRAKYLLMDSWYSFPAVISKVKRYIDVVCMVKVTSKIFYYQDGEALTLQNIYRGIRKKRGKAKIKGSKIVEMRNGENSYEVKIVFVKSKNQKRNWLAILSTDTNLSDEDIVRIYGKRWDIEVFFKMSKQCLNMNIEVQTRSYESMIAHITIVFLRYIFLTVEQRNSVDDKTFGGIFLEMVEEMQDITILESLIRIIRLAFSKVRANLIVAEKLIKEISDIFMGEVIKKYEINYNLT